jgi:hypothetical protein
MQKNIRLRWGIIKYNYLKFIKLFASYSPISLNIMNALLLGVLIYIWQVKILPTEAGFYSPFENSLSYIKYLLLIIFLNTIISLASLARSKYWVYLPIIINGFIILLTAFYFYSALRTTL